MAKFCKLDTPRKRWLFVLTLIVILGSLTISIFLINGGKAIEDRIEQRQARDKARDLKRVKEDADARKAPKPSDKPAEAAPNKVEAAGEAPSAGPVDDKEFATIRVEIVNAEGQRLNVGGLATLRYASVKAESSFGDQDQPALDTKIEDNRVVSYPFKMAEFEAGLAIFDKLPATTCLQIDTNALGHVAKSVVGVTTKVGQTQDIKIVALLGASVKGTLVNAAGDRVAMASPPIQARKSSFPASSKRAASWLNQEHSPRGPPRNSALLPATKPLRPE